MVGILKDTGTVGGIADATRCINMRKNMSVTWNEEIYVLGRVVWDTWAQEGGGGPARRWQHW